MLQMNSGNRTKNVQFGHISVFLSTHPFSLDEMSLIFVADARVSFPASPSQYTRETRIYSNISNTSDSVSSGYPNAEKRVENTTRSGVFLTKFEVFG